MIPFFGSPELMGFGAEIIYSFIIILCSLMVYFGTKELYELSSYKGIKYFRQAFLFFALAYFFRSFIKFIMIYFQVDRIIDFSPKAFGPFTLFIFIYFSTIAVFYLIYSAIWKIWNKHPNTIYIFHFLAFVMSLAILLAKSPFVYLIINAALFVFILFLIGYLMYKTEKSKMKKSNLYVVYLLLFVFWLLNVIDILIPKFLQTFQLLIYLVSTGIFLLILYRVIKKTGSK